MSRVALDFTKINTPSYRTYRVISAFGAWGQFYRERVAALSRFESAIIFPEQLLSLDQKNIWGVQFATSASKVDCSVVTVTDFRPNGGNWLSSPEAVLEFEANNAPDDLLLGIATYSNKVRFSSLLLFTNRRSALKCVTTKMTSAVGAL